MNEIFWTYSYQDLKWRTSFKVEFEMAKASSDRMVLRAALMETAGAIFGKKQADTVQTASELERSIMELGGGLG